MRRLLLVAILLCCRLCFPQAANPTFSPAPGSYATAQTVCLSDSTSGAHIWYTINGSTPTLVSTLYSGCFTVSTTTTVIMFAAVPTVNQMNDQNNNPAVGGTFWKAAVTADVGGSGVATATAHTSGNASPSLSGASMLFSETTQASKQTNVLWPVSGGYGTCNTCDHYLSDFWVYIGTNFAAGSSYEFDMYNFIPIAADCTGASDSTGNGCRLMYGMQWCHAGGGSGCPSGKQGWDFVGNLNVAWTWAGFTGSDLTATTWHHIQALNHSVPGELTSLPCVDRNGDHQPYLYYDHLIVDGVDNSNGGTGWKFCANSLPSGWSAVNGHQFQIDGASNATPQTIVYYTDDSNFIGTQPWSAIEVGTYVIGGSGPSGNNTVFGGVTHLGGKLSAN